VKVVAINAMIVEHGRLSGIGHYTAQLARWFARINQERGDGDRVLVYCRPAAVHHFEEIDGVEVRAVDSRGGRVARVVAEQVFLPRLLQRDKVDAVLNPAFTGPVWGVSTVVTTVHDPYFLVIPQLLPRAQRLFLRAFVPFCCRRSTRVVTTATATMRDLERFFPRLRGRISVIPMANRLPGPPTLPDVASASGLFVLMVAAMTGNKNPGPLVAAIGELRRRYPELTLVHVGNDNEGILEATIAHHDAQDWVISRHGVSDGELGDLYRQCLCVAVPSLCEGFGLPVLEAQAFGAPVIASNRGALPEVGGQGALYFDPTKPAGIVEAITELIEIPARRKALREAGFINQQRFTWERTAREMLNILLDPQVNKPTESEHS
jgi:glycosyltransferase involved in cell wall biosynthesis